MKKILLGIFLVVGIVLLVLFLPKYTQKPKEASIPPATLTPTPMSEVLTEVASPTPNTASPSPTSSTKYSAEVKTKARNEFVTSCNKQGHYKISECNCAADYLAANYSEIQLAKMYLQYHSTNQLPEAIETAAKVCTKK